jgi:hypothetical protein
VERLIIRVQGCHEDKLNSGARNFILGSAVGLKEVRILRQQLLTEKKFVIELSANFAQQNSSSEASIVDKLVQKFPVLFGA